MVCSYSIFYSKYDDDWATSWIKAFQQQKNALHLYIFLVQYTGRVPILMFYFIIRIIITGCIYSPFKKVLMFNYILVMFMLAENGVWLAISILLSGFICILFNFDVIYE